MYKENAGDNMVLIPLSDLDRDLVLGADRHTKEDIRKQINLIIEYDWQVYTISSCMVLAMVSSLNRIMSNIASNGAEINFYDLLSISVTMRENEDAEKMRNLFASFKPGSKMMEIVSETNRPEVESITDKDAYFGNYPGVVPEFMLKIENIAKQELKSKYNIFITKKWQIVAITKQFISNLIREMLIKATDSDDIITSCNLNDVLEIRVIKLKDNYIRISIGSGVLAKLDIKSDEISEVDEE